MPRAIQAVSRNNQLGSERAFSRAGTADAAAGPKVDVDAFRKGLSGVAAKYAITDWEVDDDTYAGIGLGLAKANVTSEEFATYSVAFSGGDAAKDAAIKRGYDGQG